MKYVFVCPDIDFLKIQYMDFSNKENSDLVTIGGTRKIAKFLNLKFKLYRASFFDIIYRRTLYRSFKRISRDSDICFIIYSRTYEDFRSVILRYIKKRFRNFKIVVYYGDLVSRHLFDIEDLKKECDMIFSFDENDSNINNVNYLLEPFSSSISQLNQFNNSSEIKYDFSFVGHAKNRLNTIYDVHNVLTKKGFSCEFYITGVDKKNRKIDNSIIYNGLDFLSLLKTVKESSCIVEVMQSNGVSPTTRFAESIIFNKLLLTNCRYFKDKEYPNVIYYDDISDIEKIDFKLLLSKKLIANDRLIELFSIDSMINTIEKCISR